MRSCSNVPAKSTSLLYPSSIRIAPIPGTESYMDAAPSCNEPVNKADAAHVSSDRSEQRSAPDAERDEGLSAPSKYNAGLEPEVSAAEPADMCAGKEAVYVR